MIRSCDNICILLTGNALVVTEKQRLSLQTSRIMMLLVSLSLLFWSLLEIQSQTVSSPYLSFKDDNLPNNSYVDISQIGNAGDGSDSVQCISELDYCCNNRK